MSCHVTNCAKKNSLPLKVAEKIGLIIKYFIVVGSG
jgi:hypothetical protein